MNIGFCLPQIQFPSTPEEAAPTLRDSGFCLLSPAQLCAVTGCTATDWRPMQPTWINLPADNYLRDGGRYRFRRHACYTQDTESGQLTPTPYRAHWQPTDYNALHGGMERWFSPVETSLENNPIWRNTLTHLGLLFHQVRPVERWFIEAHQFRIDTTDGVGRPTPEGAHRDGVDFVAVILIAREQVQGGETRVFDAHGSHGLRFEMHEPLTALLLDDTRVIHETTPIFPAEGQSSGWRDTLVITYRAGGFQEP